MKISRFTHIYEKNGRVAAFNSLLSKVVFGNRALIKLMRAIEEKGASPLLASREVLSRNLLDNGILINSEDEDKALLTQMFNQGLNQHGDRLSLMYLIPTEACNLNCSYCFVSTTKTRHRMSKDTAQKAVDYFFNHASPEGKLSIIYYGGEPLLAPGAVLASADRAIKLIESRKNNELDLSLVTNGVGISPHLAKELVSRDISVSISIDGPEDIHNAHRRHNNGGKTFSQAIESFRLFEKIGSKPTISCTVTPASLEKWNQIIDFIVNELQVEGLGFNLLLPGPFNGNGGQLEYSDSLKATDCLIEAFKVFREAGIYEDRMMRRVKPFSKKYFHFKDCLGVGGQIAVDSHGRVGPCQGLIGESEMFPLSVKQDYSTPVYSDEIFAEWTKRFPLNFDECLECPAISICGGGCPIAAKRDYGSIWKIDRRVCDQVKPVHEWLIWELFDKVARDEETGIDQSS